MRRTVGVDVWLVYAALTSGALSDRTIDVYAGRTTGWLSSSPVA